jgi:DedD protein
MEQNLKQRLVGAIVLVSLAVIFIPIILEGPDDEWTLRSHSIPEPPQIDYRASMQLQLPADTQTPAAASNEPADMQPPAQPAQTAVTPSAPPIPEPEPEPEPAPQPEPVAAEKPAAPEAAPASSAAALPAGWYVQVGSFSQQMNASGLRDRLRSAGYDTRLQATGSTYRVLVGPSDTRKQAEQQRDKLLAKQQLKGIVIQQSG